MCIFTDLNYEVSEIRSSVKKILVKYRICSFLAACYIYCGMKNSLLDRQRRGNKISILSNSIQQSVVIFSICMSCLIAVVSRVGVTHVYKNNQHHRSGLARILERQKTELAECRSICMCDKPRSARENQMTLATCVACSADYIQRSLSHGLLNDSNNILL